MTFKLPPSCENLETLTLRSRLKLPLPELTARHAPIGESAPIFELLNTVINQSQVYGVAFEGKSGVNAPAMSLCELIVRTSPPTDDDLSRIKDGLQVKAKPKTPLTILLEGIVRPGEERGAEDPVHRQGVMHLESDRRFKKKNWQVKILMKLLQEKNYAYISRNRQEIMHKTGLRWKQIYKFVFDHLDRYSPKKLENKPIFKVTRVPRICPQIIRGAASTKKPPRDMLLTR